MDRPTDAEKFITAGFEKLYGEQCKCYNILEGHIIENVPHMIIILVLLLDTASITF